MTTRREDWPVSGFNVGQKNPACKNLSGIRNCPKRRKNTDKTLSVTKFCQYLTYLLSVFYHTVAGVARVAQRNKINGLLKCIEHL